ncbi:MAG: AmmeMemoRadiSam system protein A [Candidatus Hydrogenedentes bacterium]|nr:AmmeMemoRadiSam system protein A [Candidatus Hydrogenedentota bacterium]
MTHNLDRSEHFLTRGEELTLLRVARDSLDAWVRHRRRIDIEEYGLTPALREKHGAFVTLHAHGDLRGCIGYTQNKEPLARAVSENAVNASSNDPRFEPVQPGELSSITVEVSALTPGDSPDTPFRRVHDLREIVIGRDGLYIAMPPFRGGLLLPQVATERGWNVEQFLKAVCMKAGYPDRSWENPEATLYRFSAQVFSENDADGATD